MNSASLINMAIRVSEHEKNNALVNDLLRVKQKEARRKYIKRLADEIELDIVACGLEVPNASA